MPRDTDPDRPLPPVHGDPDSAGRRVAVFVRRLWRPSVRVGVLTTVGYVCGLLGLALSFRGDPADPEGLIGVAGIALMATSFTCLFLVSIGLVNASGGKSRSSRDR